MSLVLAGLSLAEPAEASKGYEYYEKGEKAYAHRDYAAAITALTAFSQRNPQDYRPHYILGHCYCALGDYKQASFHYGYLLILPGDSAVKQKGRDCIAMMVRQEQGKGQSATSKPVATANHGDLPQPPPAPPSLVEDKRVAGASSQTDTGAHFAEARRKLVEDHKRTILAEAKRKADAILKAAEDEIEDIRVNHPQLVTNGESTFFGISTHMANYIREPARAQADKIIKDAEARVAGMPNSDPPETTASVPENSNSSSNSSSNNLINSNTHVLKTYTNWPSSRQNKEVAQKTSKIGKTL